MIKTLSKLGIESILLNLIKIIYKKPTANITVNGEKLKAFLVILGTRSDYPLSSFHFNIILEVLVNVIIQEKLYRLVGGRCLCSQMTYAENLKELTKKLLKLISDYNNTVGYKVNIQKSIVFLYINN